MFDQFLEAFSFMTSENTTAEDSIHDKLNFDMDEKQVNIFFLFLSNDSDFERKLKNKNLSKIILSR